MSPFNVDLNGFGFFAKYSLTMAPSWDFKVIPFSSANLLFVHKFFITFSCYLLHLQ